MTEEGKQSPPGLAVLGIFAAGESFHAIDPTNRLFTCKGGGSGQGTDLLLACGENSTRKHALHYGERKLVSFHEAFFMFFTCVLSPPP